MRRRILSDFFRQHLEALRKALRELVRQPLGTLLTLLAIALALALPGMLLAMLNNLHHATDPWADSRQIHVFMKLDTSEEQLNNLAAEWREDADIAAVEIISRQESLERFKASSGMADALELLEENPLPAVLVVKPAERLTSTEAVKQLAQRLSAAAAVEQIELDQDWLARLQALLKLIRASVLLLGGMFGAILMLVVGNALRFEIIRRREEIEVVKLVGGSDDYIHRPFMYSAILVGLLGSILAIILILTVFALLRPALSEFLLTYGSRQELLRLGSDTALLLPLIAIGLSLLASWLAIKLNLRYIEPQ